MRNIKIGIESVYENLYFIILYILQITIVRETDINNKLSLINRVQFTKSAIKSFFALPKILLSPGVYLIICSKGLKSKVRTYLSIKNEARIIDNEIPKKAFARVNLEKLNPKKL